MKCHRSSERGRVGGRGQPGSDTPRGQPWSLPPDARYTPVGKGILVHNMCMKLFVEKDYYTDPEQWNELSTAVQDAWMAIGAEWFPDPPTE